MFKKRFQQIINSPLPLLILGGASLFVYFLFGFLTRNLLGGELDTLLSRFPESSFFISNDSFLLFWFLIQFLLIYSPVAFQRRLLEGFQIVLALLATFGVFYLKDLVCQKPIFQKYFKEVFSNKIFLAYLSFILFFFSNFSIIVNDLTLYLENYDGMYLKKEAQEAMFWIRENTEEESIILSSLETGNLIPAFSIRQVYLGHGHQTAQFGRKASETERFFQKNNDDGKIAFLKENKIDYLFLGPKEKELIQFNPEEKNYLKKVFSNNQATIYKVNY